nr:hypothetical protein [Psychrobacter sp. PraFG1]
MANAHQNNPRKEVTYALVGVIGFLLLVLLIALSGYFRPGGQHVVSNESEDTQDTELGAESASNTDVKPLISVRDEPVETITVEAIESPKK